MFITKNDGALCGALSKALVGKDEKSIRQIQAAIQAFVMEPERVVERRIQAFGTKADLAQVVADAFTVILNNANFDLNYQRVFDPVTVGQGQDFFEIHNVVSGLTVRKVLEGQRLNVQKITGSKQTVYCDKYGGALGWTDEMIRFNKIAAMQTMARVFRNDFWVTKANVHYTLLLAAIVGNTTAWQAGATNLLRDVNTINEAAYQVANRCKDKYADTANAQYIGFFNPSEKARVLAALATTNVNQNTGGVTTNWNVTPLFSWFIPAGQGVIVLPGNMIQRADAMDPTQMSGQDILQLTYVEAIWAYYGAVIGDTDQVRGLLFA